MWHENSKAASESDINLHRVYTARERHDATQQNTIALIIISDAVSTLDAAQRDKSLTENCCRVLFIAY